MIDWAVVGGCIGGAIVLAVVVAIILFTIYMRKHASSSATLSGMNQPMMYDSSATNLTFSEVAATEE